MNYVKAEITIHCPHCETETDMGASANIPFDGVYLDSHECEECGAEFDLEYARHILKEAQQERDDARQYAMMEQRREMQC